MVTASPPMRRPARGDGFTLIELLVVIAIIALLASMLVPALKAARDSARNAICLSNLHQIGVAFAFYRSDFNDHYPPGSWDINDQPGWTFWWWDNNWMYDENLQAQGYLGDVRYHTDQESPWHKIIYASKLWTCPSGSVPYDYCGVTGEGARAGRGYGYNLDLLNYWYTYSGRGWSVPVKARDQAIITIGDRNLACFVGIAQGADLGEPPNADPNPAWESHYMTAQRHRGHINYLFTDTHAEGLTLEQAMDTDLWRWYRSFPP